MYRGDSDLYIKDYFCMSIDTICLCINVVQNVLQGEMFWLQQIVKQWQ